MTDKKEKQGIFMRFTLPGHTSDGEWLVMALADKISAPSAQQKIESAVTQPAAKPADKMAPIPGLK